jgi:hypothetical protein
MYPMQYLSIAVVLAALAPTKLAYADDCDQALSAAEPTDEQLESCTKSRPLVSLGIGAALAVGAQERRFTFSAQADVQVTRPLYLSVRSRAGGHYADVDLVAGAHLGFKYGRGNHTTVSMSNDYSRGGSHYGGYSYVQTTTAHTDEVVQRESFVVFGGIRGVRIPTNPGNMDDQPAWDGFKTYLVGGGYHYTNNHHQDSRIELVGYLRDGDKGFSLRWFNTVVAMEIGWVPVGAKKADGTDYSTTLIYWNLLEIGRFFEL